jgi:hypothetical protein
MALFFPVFAVVSGWIFAEVCGYFLHILLHSERVPYLSRNHMIHHLRIYGPRRSLRPGDVYLSSTEGRAALLGTGIEWLGPVGAIIAATFAISELLGINRQYFLVFMCSALLWGYFLFGYMHDAMHLSRFWMERVPVLAGWFRGIRKLHDIHHRQISDDGRMSTNFGICFFFMDRLLGTLSLRHKPFNSKGFAAAERRYADLLNIPNGSILRGERPPPGN